jgi:hypothetical protein
MIASLSRWPIHWRIKWMTIAIPLALTILIAPISQSYAYHTIQPEVARAGWTIACVDCPKYFYEMRDRSLRLDNDGHPHIVYGGEFLYYAYYDGSSWHYETVDNTLDVGAYAALALDGKGLAHISYYDNTNTDLKYAHQDDSGWHI